MPAGIEYQMLGKVKCTYMRPRGLIQLDIFFKLFWVSRFDV